MNSRVFVDPLMFPWAQTFFYIGLESIFGKENVFFQNSPFVDLIDPKRGFHTFNFVVENMVTKEKKKYCIDWFDKNTIVEQGAYDWCDVYGKVNTNWRITPKREYPKIVSIGPSMGVNSMSLFHSIGRYFHTGLVSKSIFSKRTMQFIHYYYREYNRYPYQKYVYTPELVTNGYVFFLSTLWYNAEWNNNDENLNTPRYQLIKSIKSIEGISFEGGLVPHNNRNNKNGYTSSVNKYSDCIYNNRMPVTEYMDKIKKSMVAINTPAVVSCHGWKLAEYLALGKCILSIPLVNDLPYPLEHGVNIHFIDGSPESVKEALMYIYSHPEYRKKLEQGARKYYEDWCAPEQALRLIGIR